VNRPLHTLAALTAVAIVTFPTVGRAAQGPDEAEIRAVVTRQGEAWTRHDAKAYAALFTEDCDVVNIVGWWWKGRAELEQKLTGAFTAVFRESQLTITEVQVRFLSPAIALAHARWTMSGARTPPGMPEPREGIQTLVLNKTAGQWLIAGFQNTLSLPERPFPTALPPAAPTPRD
jgi:uncharacterized protein (TIGR02246 family)